MKWHWVSTPSGRENLMMLSDVWIRVFALNPGDLDCPGGPYCSDPCTFYSGASSTLIAEGPGRMNTYSPDDFLTGPGTNSWGWVLTGKLDNWGACPAGQHPRLFWLKNWITHSEDISTAKTTAQMGPTLTCKK